MFPVCPPLTFTVEFFAVIASEVPPMVMVFRPVAFSSASCAEEMLDTVEPVSTVMLLGAAVVSLSAPLLTATAPSTLPPRTFRLPPVPSMVTAGAVVPFTSFRVTVLLTPFTMISPTELLVMFRLWAAWVAVGLFTPLPSSVIASTSAPFKVRVWA